jgi:hypothetical protein
MKSTENILVIVVITASMMAQTIEGLEGLFTTYSTLRRTFIPKHIVLDFPPESGLAVA